jgi:hypothetical protein
MTQADFSRKKKTSKEEIRSKERNLTKCREILTLLPVTMGGGMALPWSAKDLLRPSPLMAVSGMILLIAVGAYFAWQKPSPSNRPISEETAQTSLHPEMESTGVEAPEANGVKSLFENIRQANLRKNIGLFMSCYSRDFDDKEGKRLATLEMWKNFNYIDLSYHLKKQTITGNTADVMVEWVIRTAPKAGGQRQNTRIVLNVTLNREKGSWKIKAIRSAS